MCLSLIGNCIQAGASATNQNVLLIKMIKLVVHSFFQWKVQIKL